MKEPKFKDIYEDEKSFHDTLAMNAENSPKDIEVWEKQSYDYIIETIGNLKGKKILDIGCGFGRESILFAKKGAIVTGIDISDKSIEFARKRIFEEKLRNINFETLIIDEFANADFFDVVFCRGSLHHFPDVQIVISKAYDSFKKGGIMIVQEPKSENPIAIIGRRFFNPSTPTEHPFSIGELELIFRNRFGNVSAEYFYLFSPLCFIFEKISLLNSGLLKHITFKVFDLMDKVLLSFNMFKKYCWVEVVWSIK